MENEALIDKRDMTLVRFLAPEITGTYEIAQGIRAIGPSAFELDRHLSSVVIPDSVTEIGAEVFAYCDSLKEIVIPDSVVSIGGDAFYRCVSLGSVTIPDSVTKIGSDVFSDCYSLTSISISPDHPVYEVIDLLLVRKSDKAVISASGALRGSYAVPEEIRNIGDCAFQGCRELEELFIPDTVTGIGEYAFNTYTVIRACAGSAAQEYCAADSRYRFTEITPEAYAEEVQKLEQEKAAGEPAEPVYSGEEEADNRVFGKYEYRVLEDGAAEITKADGFLENESVPSDLDGHPVTSIASRAFMDCYKLQSVVIPEGVVSVGRNAFWGCYALELVTIPDSLVSTEGQMFISCPKLKTVEVSPDHPVFAVENNALVNRQDRTLIVVLDHEDAGAYTVAEGIRKIEDTAFECASISSVLLPDSVTSIGDHAFTSCENLTEMNFPEGVTDIGSQAFYANYRLESVTIPDSVTRIGSGVFAHTRALTTVRISPRHPAYEMNGSLLVDKRDRKIVMALNSTSGVFEIPEGIEKIGSLAFQGCSALTELIVPEGVTDIGSSAFVDCNELRVVTLPASLNDIGPIACYSSEGLLIKAPAGSWAEQYARENGYRFEALPESADGAFAEEQDLYLYRIKEDGTAEIGGISNKEMKALEIPAELDGIPVTSIGTDAFMGCKNLQSAVIPEGVVSVGDSAFWYCPELETVSIPDSLVSVGPQAFALCWKLKNVEVSPDHPVFAVENRALVNRPEQTLITVLDHEDTGAYTVTQGIRRIASFAFDGASFSSILLPDSLVSVGALAFSDCMNLTEMIFPEGVTDIGHQVLHGSVRLESVTFPDSVTRIGMAAFGNNPALKTVRISPDNPAYEMNGPFLVDRRNQEIVTVLNNMPAICEIPEGIRAVGELAFQGSCDPAEIIVPESVTKIGDSAFSTCTNLRVITLPAGLSEIGDRVFEFCPEGLLIKAPAGSPAEQYARENGYRFEAIPSETDGAD